MGPKLLVGGAPSSRQANPQFLVLFEKVHIEITAGLQPPLMGLDRQRPDEPQAAGGIRENPRYPGPSFDLFLSLQNLLHTTLKGIAKKIKQ